MRALLFLLFVVTSAGAAPVEPEPEPEPELSKERVIFHTVGGDLVFALFPKVAPVTVKKFLELARSGVYDGTHFFRVEPTFLVQLGVAQDRQHPLTAAQRSLIQKLPAEFSKELKHHVFTLSMARETADVNSAESSFSILLNDAPHLDGLYTIFGRLEYGVQTLFEMLKVSRDTSHRPSLRLTVQSVEVVDAKKLATMRLRGPFPLVDPASTDDAKLSDLRRTLGGGLLFLMLLSLGGYLFRARLAARHVASLWLVQVFVAMFLALPLLIPLGHAHQWLAPFVFLGLVGMFRLLARFEST